MKELWNKEQERKFFIEARKFATIEKLFYNMSDTGRYFSYWPKKYKGKKTTLQSRNSLIGNFTERWCFDLLYDFAKTQDCHVVNGVICDEIGLTNRSPADLAICTLRNTIQSTNNIRALFGKRGNHLGSLVNQFKSIKQQLI